MQKKKILREANVSLLLFYLLFCLVSACASKPQELQLCPNVLIHSDEKLDFSETEKQFICGDPESIAYKIVPIYQAKFSMQGFLQSRGFSHPKFVYEGEKLTVFTEEKTRLGEVKVVSEENSKEIIDTKSIEKEIYRHHKKEILTPKLLDKIESRAKSLLRDKGYPCVKVSSAVDSQTGVLTITLNDLVSFNFGEVKKEPIEGVNEKALERFYSFKANESFKEHELLLTEKRFLRQGIVAANFFEESCNLPENSFSLHHKFITGPPHTVRFGVGASTELGPMARAKWTNQRYGEMASLLEANIQASFKNQSINLLVDKYFWEDSPRRSLNTELSYERNDQNTFLETMGTLKPHLKWTRDTENRFWLWSVGPSLIAGSFKTDNNSDRRTFKTGAIEGRLESNTHIYETFDTHPEEGEFYKFDFDFRHPSLGFSDPLLKLDLTYLRFLWLGNLGKGNAIMGLRLNTQTTWVPNDVNSTTLPPSVKFYGGGSDDIRGFKLNSIPDTNGLGALTKMSAKLELRRTNFFKESLESFIFLDTGFFGDQSWKVDSRIWYSPGAGVRWLSPIGLVQTFVARGLSNKSSTHFDQDSGNFFYLGLGGVF